MDTKGGKPGGWGGGGGMNWEIRRLLGKNRHQKKVRVYLQSAEEK